MQVTETPETAGNTGSDPRNASVYCDYNETFTGYDQMRQPHGLDTLLEIFSRTSAPLAEQSVLEGGFGTGNYIAGICCEVGEVHGVEGSDKGLQQAMKKLKNAENVHLRMGNILDLPFSEETFDAYMVNQVLHHLEDGDPFSRADRFLEEARRVLKPGGCLSINTCSQEQLDPDTGVYWHYKYIPSAVRAMTTRYIPVHELKARLASLGFTDIHEAVPSGSIFMEAYYRTPETALEPDFRKGDSVYSFLDDAGVETANTLLQSAIASGAVFKDMERAAARAAEIGETVFISARKK